MKNLFKYIGIFSLFVFSLIYTNKTAEYMRSKTSLMKQIKRESKVKETKAINAIIEGDYIIPGLNGLVIDEKESYSNMVVSGIFDENLFVFKQVTPTISLSNNLEKIIRKANRYKRAVSIIIDDQNLLNYFVKEDIKVNYLIDETNILKSDKAELINNEVKNFHKIENFLNRNNYNHNICVINKYNKDICKNNHKYLITPTYIVNNSNLAKYITEIDSGDIIKIDNMSINNLDYLINKIKYFDLNILYLSELISENNNAI